MIEPRGEQSGQVQVVTFRLGSDTFAAGVFDVERVIEHQPPKTVPGAPGWMEGVIEYQSRVVPAIDLRKRFELPPADGEAGRRIIVFNVDGQWIGAIVDAVNEVRTVEQSAINAPPPIFRGLPCEYLTGILQEGKQLTIYLDIRRLLTTAERLALKEISTPDSG